MKEGLSGALIQQLCDMLHEVGERQVASVLSSEAEPRPVAVARTLARTLGKNCLLTLDNCETLVGPGGEFVDPVARDLVMALIGQTGWRLLLTSREKLSFAQAGYDPFPIAWLSVGEVSYAERAALLRVGQTRSRLDFDALDPDVERLIITEVAGHPYELNLFLGDARPGMDLERLIFDVHRRTGEYARLDYYLHRVPDDFRPILWLLAALDEPTESGLLDAVWSAVAGHRGWRQDPDYLAPALVELVGRGLVEENEDSYAVLPILRSHLTESASPYRLDEAALGALHRDLAKLFEALSKAASEQVRALLDRSA